MALNLHAVGTLHCVQGLVVPGVVFQDSHNIVAAEVGKGVSALPADAC